MRYRDDQDKNERPHGSGNHGQRDLKDAPMGILLRHAEHTHDIHVRERLDAGGVPKAFGPFLMTIEQNEGVTQAEIAEKMHFAAATVSVTLQKMVDAGYISKISDDSDCRQMRIFLTEKGRDTAQEMHSIFRELEEQLVEPLTDDEKAELRRLLLKITVRN